MGKNSKVVCNPRGDKKAWHCLKILMEIGVAGLTRMSKGLLIPFMP